MKIFTVWCIGVCVLTRLAYVVRGLLLHLSYACVVVLMHVAIFVFVIAAWSAVEALKKAGKLLAI